MKRPILIVLSDLHWADQVVLDVVGPCSTASPTAAS